MKYIRNLFLAVAISTVPFGSFAQTISAKASTINEAEAQIAAQAKKSSASYQITGTYFKNGVYMIANLTK